MAIIVDTTPPGAPLISSPAMGVITRDDTPEVSGASQANQVVHLFDTGDMTTLGSTMSGSAGGWRIVTTALADGDYILAATAADAAGNVSALSASLALTVDTLPPVVDAGHDISGTGTPVPQDASLTDATAVTYQWGQRTGEPGVVVFSDTTVEDPSISATSDGTFVLRLTATDAAGNSAFDEIKFVWDSAPPRLVHHLPTPAETGVALDRQIRMVFSKPMATGPFLSGALLVNGGATTGTTTFAAENTVVIFTPAGGFSPSASYDVSLSTAITDEQGVSLSAPVSWAFVTTGAEVPAVIPWYSSHGAHWNQYVDNDGGGPLSAADRGCTGEGGGPYTACPHGGEMRAVPVSGQSSCTDHHCQR